MWLHGSTVLCGGHMQFRVLRESMPHSVTLLIDDEPGQMTLWFDAGEITAEGAQVLEETLSVVARSWTRRPAYRADHTSPVRIRVMRKHGMPYSMMWVQDAPGRLVYRFNEDLITENGRRDLEDALTYVASGWSRAVQAAPQALGWAAG